MYLVDVNRPYAQVLEEYNGSDIQASYVYGNSLISQSRSGIKSFYSQDGHSGVRKLTNSLGVVTDSYNYDAYGTLINSTGSTLNNYLYRGEQFDKGLNQYYLRDRYYGTDIGRFTQTDRFEGDIMSPMSRHRFMYGNAKPITFSDPSGMFAGISEVLTVLSIIESLTIVTGAQIALGLAARLSGNIEWEGKLTSASVKGEVFGSDINLGLSILNLTTISNDEVSPFLYPELRGNFNGRWLQLYGGIGIGNEIPDSLKPLSPNSLSPDSSVIAKSPRIFAATPLVFTGTFALASSYSGGASVKAFTAGFGFGYSANYLSSKAVNKIDVGISLKEGISIPISFFPA
jgi:RHS repeat-associated protein